MKLLIAGDWLYPMYEAAFMRAVQSQGWNVCKFSWAQYFSSIIGKAESKWGLLGPMTLSMNNIFVRKVIQEKPDVILVWRGINMLAMSLKKIKLNRKLTLVSYNHDDFTGPYVGAPTPYHHKLFWKTFLNSSPNYHIHLVKRIDNIQHLNLLGTSRAYVFPMWYVPEIHRPIKLTNEEKARFSCDIVFAGHHEPDGRENYLKSLVKAGLHVRLFGGKYWTPEVLGETAQYFGKVHEVQGDDYAKALSGASMCLCFLSKLNRDTYTRRCFEIPACGSLLLSERTAHLQQLFREDEEAVFFSSVDELVEKALWLKSYPEEINRIAAAGKRRVHADGHSVDDRARQFIELVERVRSTEQL